MSQEPKPDPREGSVVTAESVAKSDVQSLVSRLPSDLHIYAMDHMTTHIHAHKINVIFKELCLHPVSVAYHLRQRVSTLQSPQVCHSAKLRIWDICSNRGPILLLLALIVPHDYTHSWASNEKPRLPWALPCPCQCNPEVCGRCWGRVGRGPKKGVKKKEMGAKGRGQDGWGKGWSQNRDAGRN